MTTIIVSAPDLPWVEPTTDLLRQHGMKVVRLANLSIIGFLLMSARIAAVVIHEDSLPSDWIVVQQRMGRIAPNSKIVIVPRGDQLSPPDLVSLVTS